MYSVVRCNLKNICLRIYKYALNKNEIDKHRDKHVKSTRKYMNPFL